MVAPPADKPSDAPRRPWWRLHVSTCLLMLLLLAGLAAVVAVGDYVPYGRGIVVEHGWPLVFLQREGPTDKGPGPLNGWRVSLWSWTDHVTRFHPLPLALDVALALAILAVVTALAEWRRRRRKRVWQVTLREGLAATLLLALACGWIAREFQQTQSQQRAVDAIEANAAMLFYAEWDARFDAVSQLLGETWYAEVPPRVGRVSVLDLSTDQPDFVLQKIGQLTELRYLSLCCEAPPGEARHDLSPLAKLHRLQTLDLRSLASDEGLRHLAGLQRLHWLGLSNNDLTDAALPHLANLRRLEYLSLAHNQITDEGLVHLAGLKRLKFLDLTNTQVTDEGLDRLLEALPDLEITDD